MTPLRRLAIALSIVWILVATNPDATSFRRYLSARRAAIANESFRLAVPPITLLLKNVFDAAPPAATARLHSDGLDCGLFTIVRLQSEEYLRAQSMSFINPPSPPLVFLGILGKWLPVPNPATWFEGDTLRRGFVDLRDVVRSQVRSPSTGSLALPARPWEWLVACFAVAGAFWYIMPEAAGRHLTLTWENARHAGRWWTLVLFHLSHGGSVLRLSRTVAACNYLAPLIVKHRVLTLSGLYGVVLTASAMSTALGILVLARRNVFGARGAPLRSALEINGGGGCVYAMLVAACMDAQSGRPGAIKAWRVRPFELLMLNIAFDAMFLAGQKRIADYTAHTGAALGAWVYVAFNR